MNLQQLEYIVAVDRLKNFVKASEVCFVTQATLSMMIKKLEDELDIKIFDRSKQPVKTTIIGIELITQAQKILLESKKIKEIVASEKGIVSGELKLGIIPTLAPYLLPLFLKKMKEAFPLVKLQINELTTDVIIQKLKTGEIDIGILATPLHDKRLNERPLFYEKYYLYVNDKEKGFNKQFVLPKEIDVNRLWLLEEGHCMRTQILNFCALKKQHEFEESFHYNAGSIETLKNMVDANFGMTIIPELATHNLSKTQSKRIRLFNDPIPVREISLVTHREFLKEKLIKKLEEVILSVIPSEMQVNKKRNIIEL